MNDWAYTHFDPASCTDCDPFNQPAKLVGWTLENDDGYNGAVYSTDNDANIRFFLSIGAAPAYRDLLLGTHDPIHAAFPDRYKRFIHAGSSAHAAIAGGLFYSATSNGIPLYQWVADFVNDDPGWVDTVEQGAVGIERLRSEGDAGSPSPAEGFSRRSCAGGGCPSPQPVA